jgi:hypothetical protein
VNSFRKALRRRGAWLTARELRMVTDLLLLLKVMDQTGPAPRTMLTEEERMLILRIARRAEEVAP